MENKKNYKIIKNKDIEKNLKKENIPKLYDYNNNKANYFLVIKNLVK